MKLTKRIMHSAPNSSHDTFVLVHKSSAEARGNPHWRIRLWQLIGGPTWSLSFIRNDHPEHLHPGRPIETVFAEHELNPAQTPLDEANEQNRYIQNARDHWIETAKRRNARIAQLIGVQYGMVYDIAHLMNSLYEEMHTVMVGQKGHGMRIARYMFDDLLALCPDQDPRIETPE